MGSRAVGVYVPPFKQRAALALLLETSSQDNAIQAEEARQRVMWTALRKSINGLVNKVAAVNLSSVSAELLSENVVRGRGLVCRALLKAQMASPAFTAVYAALLAICNTRVPQLGHLLLRRLIRALQRALRRRDKLACHAASQFLAALINAQVAHELLALELLTMLLETPTDDSVELAVQFVKWTGSFLTEVVPRGVHAIFERFRAILHEGVHADESNDGKSTGVDKRVQYMIEGLFAVRKHKFASYPAIQPELDLVEHDDQITHELSLADEHEPERDLDVFHFDPEFNENEAKYDEFKRELLEHDDDDEAADHDDDTSGDDEGDGRTNNDAAQSLQSKELQPMEIVDETGGGDVELRRAIYLIIMSSMDFEEATHKILKQSGLREGKDEKVLTEMVIECCAQERTFLKFYALLAERFCRLHRSYAEAFEECFEQQYEHVHRLETNKMRNVAKLFAHLLQSFVIDWDVLEYIELSEESTTSSSRIFVKILFQELSETMGLRRLRQQLFQPADERLLQSFVGLFPRDHPRKTRFAINYFTSIGLGGLTDNLREHLKQQQKVLLEQQQQRQREEEDESSSDSKLDVSADSNSVYGSSSSRSESSLSSDSRRDRRGSRNDDSSVSSSSTRLRHRRRRQRMDVNRDDDIEKKRSALQSKRSSRSESMGRSNNNRRQDTRKLHQRTSRSRSPRRSPRRSRYDSRSPSRSPRYRRRSSRD